ncbi:LRR domain containing protein [Parasponia andersonii]|uniref:LRR domain containing protein n=1 Tax=Parasponia andersonii TaxID=3476 RepID=A0A2P5CS10_PARAD|nr:LRR domain containing protein [Parasponia andersonii]
MEALVGKALDECMGSQSTILPEGVIVLGRILSREKNTLDLEGRLLNRVKLCILKGKIHDLEDSSHTGLSEVFNRSYHDFSPSDHVRLKQQCFQLLASFAENSEMRVTEVCQLLMVVLDREWNVRFGQNGMSSELNEDEAYALLYDLAQRSLVSVEEVSSTGRIKTIRLKGLMRDFCVSVAKQADLQLQVIDSGNLDQEMGSFASGRTAKEVHPMTKQRMLSINGAMDDRQCRNISKNARYWGLSSFICSETLPAGSGLKKLLKRFKRLRILKLENQESFVKIAKRIGKLKFLMFLSLKCSLVKEVPSSISELKFLQTLDLRTNCALKLPNLLWKLKRLRHLCLPHEGYIVRGEEKLRLDGLISLRKLVNISIEDCDLKVLVTFRKLERLVCVRRSPGQVSFPRTDDKFDCLKSLTVEIPFGADVDISPILSCCGPSVKRLRLIGIRTLPEVNEFPPNLHKLTLKKAYLRDDPMMILGKLPYLKFLRLLAKVFNGTEMNCSQGDFKLLVSLRLEKQQHLERWNVAEGSLCHLQRLEIVECRNLSPNPDALRRAPLLREILIHEMPEQFKSEVQRQMQNLTLLLA